MCLLWIFRAQLHDRPLATRGAAPEVDRPLLWLCGAALVGVVGCFFAGLSMAWAALIGAALVVAISGKPPREQLLQVDWVLLLFFASLFIVVYGVNQEGWAERLRGAFAPLLQGSRVREMLAFSGLSVLTRKSMCEAMNSSPLATVIAP